jgi:hypothetical protein
MVSNDTQVCEVCNLGTLVSTTRELSFGEWTTKGYVSCRVTLPMLVCDRCGDRTLDEAAEAIVEEAVKREVDKLP